MSSTPTDIVPNAVNCNHVKTPCPDCPFSRTVTPGALGGSSPLTYIGQAVGPFVLPCHKHCDFNDPNWRAKTISTPQCAGAAIFRANTGIAGYLPEAIHRLPQDHGAVFSTSAEFLAHHARMTLRQATIMLTLTTPHELLQYQLSKQEVINFSVGG